MKFREGLETLGTEELQENGKPHYGVFAESALDDVRLPSTLKLIEYGAFESCGNLRAINLPENLEHVGKLCFWGSALESVRLPPALKTIEESAFDQCKGLKSVEFPDALEKICANAFFMSGIEKADLPASLKTVDQSAFADCGWLAVVWAGPVAHPRKTQAGRRVPEHPAKYRSPARRKEFRRT